MTPSRNIHAATTHLPPVFALEAAQVGLSAQDAMDEDWAEFMSLGMEVSPAELGSSGGWKNGPVLLSY